MSERADTAEKAEVPRGGAFGPTEQIMAYFPKCDYGADETAPIQCLRLLISL